MFPKFSTVQVSSSIKFSFYPRDKKISQKKPLFTSHERVSRIYTVYNYINFSRILIAIYHEYTNNIIIHNEYILRRCFVPCCIIETQFIREDAVAPQLRYLSFMLGRLEKKIRIYRIINQRAKPSDQSSFLTTR